jgi:phage recombination protein Bet
MREDHQMTAIMKTTPEQQPRRASVMMDMAARFGMEPNAFEKVMRATVFPSNGAPEHLAGFLLVAKEYALNPLTKEIYAFATKGGGIMPIVSIDGWVSLINRNPQFDGLTFDDHLDAKDAVTAITARMFRKDRSHPTEVTEYMSECARPTDPWKQFPRRMLRHKALIQAARYAFGYSGIYDPDEAERIAATEPAPSRPHIAAPVAQIAAQDDANDTLAPGLTTLIDEVAQALLDCATVAKIDALYAGMEARFDADVPPPDRWRVERLFSDARATMEAGQ